MTRPKRNDETIQVTKQDLMRMLTEDNAMKSLLQTMLQEVLEAEMDEALGAGKNERTSGRLGYSLRLRELLTREESTRGTYSDGWLENDSFWLDHGSERGGRRLQIPEGSDHRRRGCLVCVWKIHCRYQSKQSVPLRINPYWNTFGNLRPSAIRYV